MKYVWKKIYVILVLVFFGIFVLPELKVNAQDTRPNAPYPEILSEMSEGFVPYLNCWVKYNYKDMDYLSQDYVTYLDSKVESYKFAFTLDQALQTKKDSVFTITPYELINEYCLNPILTEKKYRNKVLGIVATYVYFGGECPDCDANGKYFMDLQMGCNYFPSVIVNFPNNPCPKSKNKMSCFDLHSVIKIKGIFLGLKVDGDVANIIIQGEELQVNKEDQFSKKDWNNILPGETSSDVNSQ